MDAGVDLATVAALAGHANLDVAQLYCLPGEHDLAQAVERVTWE